MEEVVRQDILEVLKQGVQAIRQDDSFRVKELSNHVIHNASIFQDEDSLGVAVLMYALSKVMERGRLDMEEVSRLLERASAALDTYNDEGYRIAVKFAIRRVSEADSRLKIFVNSVIDQAQLKKGSKIVMHGVSAARAANILGISRWELMQYLGHTTFHEENPETVSAVDRLALARKVFGK
ncbi:hypothetical protein HYU18_00995 [Candidatus Woesearchaeota archaeon]|nr:hypothetical protein [Candidatus Woesearchaeota archaeon]